MTAKASRLQPDGAEGEGCAGGRHRGRAQGSPGTLPPRSPGRWQHARGADGQGARPEPLSPGFYLVRPQGRADLSHVAREARMISSGQTSQGLGVGGKGPDPTWAGQTLHCTGRPWTAADSLSARIMRVPEKLHHGDGGVYGPGQIFS